MPRCCGEVSGACEFDATQAHGKHREALDEANERIEGLKALNRRLIEALRQTKDACTPESRETKESVAPVNVRSDVEQDEDGDGDVNETDACDGEEHRGAGGHRLRLVFYAGTCLERIIPRDCLVHWVHSSWYQNISALALTLRARSTGLGCIRKVLAGAGVHHSHPGYSAAGAEVGGMHRLGGTRASHVVSLGTAMDPSV